MKTSQSGSQRMLSPGVKSCGHLSLEHLLQRRMENGSVGRLASRQGVSRKSRGRMEVFTPAMTISLTQNFFWNFSRFSLLELEARLGLESQMEMPPGTGRRCEKAKDMLYQRWPMHGQLAACAQTSSSPFSSPLSPVSSPQNCRKQNQTKAKPTKMAAS